MSEQEREKRVEEAIELLSGLMPAALDSDRDRLFFCAGVASARAEAATSQRRQFVWPAVAASLAIVAAGLTYALTTQETEMQIVYIQRPSEKAGGEVKNQPGLSNAATRQATSQDEMIQGERMERRLSDHDGMIQPQDYRALSDAFAQQLRLRDERVLEREAALAAAPMDPANRNDADTPPERRPRTYLEMRDALRAM
jgi:hypothetical protein